MKVQHFRIPGKCLNSRDKFLDALGSKDSSWKNIQVYCEVFLLQRCPVLMWPWGRGQLCHTEPHYGDSTCIQYELCRGLGRGGDTFHTAKGDNAPSSLVTIKHGPCPSIYTKSLFQVLLMVSSWPSPLYSQSCTLRVSGERNSELEGSHCERLQCESQGKVRV